MDLYQRNLATSLKTHPYMAGIFNKEYKEEIELENIDTPSGFITCRVKDRNNKRVHLHSSFNPVKEAKKYADTLDYSKNSMVIVFGFGLGYHIREIMNRVSKDSKIIVIESKLDIYLNALKNVDITDILESEKVIIMLGSDNEIKFKMDELFRSRIFILSSNLQFFFLPGQEILFGNSYDNVRKGIMDSIKNLYFEIGNDVEDTLIGVRQNFENIDEIIENPGCDRFEDIYKDKPAIIVSAGPSLAKNVDLLKDVVGKALILCVDASIKVLVEKGITPDAILSIERGLPTYQLFYENKTIPEKSVLVAPPVVRPEIFKTVKGKKIICLKETENINTWINKSVKKGIINMGSSVAHLAFGFARKLGADPVIFIGQDLAYSPKGFSHSKGTAYEGNRAEIKVDANTVMVEDYNGNPIPSTRIWNNFLTWFETQIAKYPDIKFIDATEGGARIKGTEVMTFRAAIDTYCKKEIPRLWQVVGDEDLNDKQVRKMYLRVYAEVLRVKREFFRAKDRCYKYFEKLLKTEKKYNIDKCSRKQLIKILEKMKESDEVLADMRKTRLVMFFFQTIFLNTYRRFSNLGHEITNENVKENIRIQKHFYGQITLLSEITGKEFETVAEGIKEKYKNKFLQG